jgi:uncharacterized protein
MESEIKHFLVKLIPPRPDFAITMTDEEREIMREHSVFWKDLLEQRICIVYGPVFEPEITYGIGIVGFKNEATAHKILIKDPSVMKGLNRIEMFQMMAVTK